jgi:hypothetical protein
MQIIPGIVGFGTDTRAAYGLAPGTNPSVLKVTNLNDSGAGSFRAAVTTSGPRVVVFEVSGYIDLLSPIFITEPYLTIAAQTAPSPGITIRAAANDVVVEVVTHDVLVWHLRVRPGVSLGSTCNDALGSWTEPSLTTDTPNNIVFVNCSASWGQDEVMFVDGGRQTIWRCLIAEGLYAATGSSSCRADGLFETGHGLLINICEGCSVIQTVFANCLERTPYAHGGTSLHVLNSIRYQWYQQWGIALDNQYGLPWFATVVSNRNILGPDTINPDDANYATLFLYGPGMGGEIAQNQIYRRDNTVANPDPRLWEEDNRIGYDPNVSSPPIGCDIPSGYTVLPSTDLEAFLLPRVGARPLDRDAVDARLVTQIQNRTGNLYLQSESNVGGFPSLANNSATFTTVANPHDDSGNGYTNLEVQLQQYAAALEPGGGTGTGSTIQFVNRAINGTTTAGPDISSSPLTTIAGALLVAMFYFDDPASTLTAISDTAGNTWTQVGAVVDGLSGSHCDQWYAYNVRASIGNIVTGTFDVDTGYRLCVVEQFTGVHDSSDPLIDQDSGTGTSTAPATPSLSLGANAEAVLVAFVEADQMSLVAGPGLTGSPFNIIGDANQYFMDEYEIVTASRTATATCASGNWMIKAALFKAIAETIPGGTTTLARLNRGSRRASRRASGRGRR